MSTPVAAAAERACGVLLHISALPGSPVCGSLGAAARDWIDLLGRAGVGVWQVLPLAPTDGTGSPYSSPSGSAINPWLLDADDLVNDGMISAADREGLPGQPRSGETEAAGRPLDPQLAGARATALGTALRRRWSQQPAERQQAFAVWEQRHRSWLVDHCRFMVLRRLQQGRPWWQWPEPLARRRPSELRRLVERQSEALQEEALLQWQLQLQWHRLQTRAAAAGVLLVGDLPFYVAHDSADVWCHPGLFALRPDGGLIEQSGVPPDYFAATGQLWGTPVYRWWRHRISGFQWWLERLMRQLELFDRLRLDHFRALEAFWSVPGEAPTAEHGQWRRSPGGSLLRRLQRRCRRAGRLLVGARLPLIAEDLGVITPEVEALRDGFALPGMKVLQFAFDGQPDNPYLPANFQGERWVVYTGTHDNATTVGWWRSLDDGSRERMAAVVGAGIGAPAWQLLELALASAAELAVVPLQDLLELGDEARFNTPGTSTGNWCWRLDRPISALDGPLEGFGAMAERYGRRSGAAGLAAGGSGGNR